MATNFRNFVSGINIGTLASAPSSPQNGDIYYDTGLQKFQKYENGAFRNFQFGVVNADVDAAAAIAYSKLALTNSIVNADIATAAAIAYSKLALTGTIVNADIATGAAIAYSKLALTGTIVNADIATGAAIAFNKLAALTSANILVGNGSNVATAVGVTGDVSLSNAGVTAVVTVGGATAAAVATAAAAVAAATAANTASTLVLRDSSGNFAAGQISAETSLRLKDSSTHYATLKAAASTTSYSLTLPPAVATFNSAVLVSDTSGNITYANIPVGSAGDIAEQSFTAADNVASPANVTGFAFANATVRSFEALVSIVRNTTFANYSLRGIQKGSAWEMSQDFTGDVTGLTFSITTAGQVQYTSNATGSTATVKFRAITTTV